jgi:hypothetical protein
VASERPAPPPYVAAEVFGGRLVRICPECREKIVETTDEAGFVTDNFSAHWEGSHREQPPERERYYVIALQPREDGQPGPGPDALRNVSRQVLQVVKERMSEIDWELVGRVEDLPERAPALIGSDVLRGMWQMEGDDPQIRRVRLYRREGDKLVFTPSKAQYGEWDAARKRANDVRAALIERHRDELPKFNGKSVAGWERFSKRLMQEEDAIAASFDAKHEAASTQFHCGDYRWEATLEAAIAALGIPEDEVEALREQRRSRLEEAEAMLAAQAGTWLE